MSDFFCLAFISRTSNYPTATHAIALTYDAQKGLTTAIVQGDIDPVFFATFVRYLKERAELAIHPAFLLSIAAQVEYDDMESWFEFCADQLRDIEFVIGHGSHFMPKKDDLSEGKIDQLDLHASLKQVNHVSSNISKNLERLNSWLLRHEKNMEFFELIRSKYQTSDNSRMKANEIKEHAQLLASAVRNLLLRFEAFERSIKNQLAVVGTTTFYETTLCLQCYNRSTAILRRERAD